MMMSLAKYLGLRTLTRRLGIRQEGMEVVSGQNTFLAMTGVHSKVQMAHEQ